MKVVRSKSSFFWRTFVIINFILLVYNFHRYIFKYNDENTSPTYTNTPLTWKVLKYVILGFLISVLHFSFKWKRNFNRTALTVILSFCFWIIMVNLLNYMKFDFKIDELEAIIWAIILFPLIFLSVDEKIEISKFYDNYFLPVSYAVIVTNAIVIFNFYIFGRLPALGYEGSLVRFGGLWDDPNGFGFFSNFLCFISLNKRKWLIFLLLSV